MYLSLHKFTENPIRIDRDEDDIWLRTEGFSIAFSVDEARTLVDRINALLDVQEQKVEAE